MPGKANFRNSLRKESKYQPKNPKPPMYETFWGTTNHRDSRQFTSLKLAKHPLIAWVRDLKSFADRHGTVAERAAVYDIVDEIDRLEDFRGTKRFEVDIESANMHASAVMVRL